MLVAGLQKGSYLDPLFRYDDVRWAGYQQSLIQITYLEAQQTTTPSPPKKFEMNLLIKKKLCLNITREGEGEQKRREEKERESAYPMEVHINTLGNDLYYTYQSGYKYHCWLPDL